MTHDELREAVARIVAQGKCKYMPEYTAEEWEGWRKIADRIRALIDGGGLLKEAVDWYRVHRLADFTGQYDNTLSAKLWLEIDARVSRFPTRTPQKPQGDAP